MSWWALLIFVTATWLLWAVWGLLGLQADKLEHKRPQDAGISIMPIIPFFPLIAFGVAMCLNAVFDPWGTRIVGAIHALLIVIFLAGIAREVLRIRSANSG